jgi:Carboxypeptidase regulatory-like domain
MRRVIAISLLGLLMASFRALPRQQANGVIEGTVVRSDTGAPIKAVYVTLYLPSEKTVTAVTDADGKFSFKNLNAGTYRVLATGSGFVRHEYDERNLNGWGGPIVLSAGQTFKDAVLRMTPTGTVRGRILDENGRPATGATVQLLGIVYNVDGRANQPRGFGVANNLGEYHLEGVVPGRYYLLAGTRAVPGGQLSSQQPQFNLVYFPSASSMEQASMIEVGSDVETLVDMQVRRSGPNHRVRGRIVDGTGSGWPTNPLIILSDGSRDGTVAYTTERTIDRATGLFELEDVPAGDYTLHVTGDPTGTGIDRFLTVLEPAGVAQIHVVDKDLEGVVVTLTRGVAVNGRILVEGEPASIIPNLQQMMLGVRPFKRAAPYYRAPLAAPAASDGTFRVAGLREDAEYRAFLIGIPPGSGLYLKSIRFNGDDVLSKPLKFSGSAAGGFEVVLGTRGLGQIAGNVRDSKSQAVPGALVVAVPVERGQITDYRTTYADQNGRYTLGDITPADYQLFSWESIEDGAFYDPDFLQQYEGQGRAIHVEKSSSQNVDVLAIPAP